LICPDDAHLKAVEKRNGDNGEEEKES